MLRKIIVTALLAASAMQPVAAEQGDWLLRLRGLVVAPTDQSSEVLPAFPGSSVDVTNAVVPELDITYFLTDNIGIETIAGTSPHDIVGEGTLAGVEIAEVMALPPTVTLQYHFNPNGRIRPYAGVGVNFTVFYSIDAADQLVAAVGPTDIDIDTSWGVSYQAGVDFALNDRWFVNADIKYIQIDTTATLTSGSLVNTVDVDLDPIVAGVGVGFKF